MAALVAPAAAGAAESRPINIVADTASNGSSYRIDLTRRTSRRVTELCLTLRVRSERKRPVRSRRRCSAGRSFEYASPSLLVANERDPDGAPLIYGFAVTGLGNVQVALAGDRPPANATLRAVPSRFGVTAYVLVARGLEAAPTGVRAFGRGGEALDGVLFPAV